MSTASIPPPLDGVGFTFDIIVTRINLLADKELDITKLIIDAYFNSRGLRITSSRINVDNFKPNNAIDFTENPKVLQENLRKLPLECKVWYKRNIGICSFFLPEGFIKCLSRSKKECSKELTYCHQEDIKNEGKVVGNMEVFMRLLIKCDEFKEDNAPGSNMNMCDSPYTTVIDPYDVQFKVEDRMGSNICNEVDVSRNLSGSNSSNKQAKQAEESYESGQRNEKVKFPWGQPQTRSMDYLSDRKLASCSSPSIKPKPCCNKHHYGSCELSRGHKNI